MALVSCDYAQRSPRMSHVTFPGVSYSPRHSYGTVPYGRKRKAGRSSQRQQRLIPSRDAPSRSLPPELRPPGSEERARFVSISWFAGPWHVDGQGGRKTDPEDAAVWSLEEGWLGTCGQRRMNAVHEQKPA